MFGCPSVTVSGPCGPGVLNSGSDSSALFLIKLRITEARGRLRPKHIFLPGQRVSFPKFTGSVSSTARPAICSTCTSRSEQKEPGTLRRVQDPDFTFFRKISLPEEFPLRLSGLRTPQSVREDEGSIPDLTQWVKNLALPQAAV